MKTEAKHELREQEATKRPWTWQDFGYGLILTSCASGRPIVMDFVRKGMNRAEPRFGKRTDSMGGIMVPLSEWSQLPPDAEFILRAVNNHDALVAALRELREMFFVDAKSGANVIDGEMVHVDNKEHPWIPGARAPEAIALIDAALAAAQETK